MKIIREFKRNTGRCFKKYTDFFSGEIKENVKESKEE